MFDTMDTITTAKGFVTVAKHFTEWVVIWRVGKNDGARTFPFRDLNGARVLFEKKAAKIS